MLYRYQKWINPSLAKYMYHLLFSSKSRDWYKNRILRPYIKKRIPLVQGHPVVFYQNFCFSRKENYLFYLKTKKRWKPHYAVCEVFVILIRMLAQVKNANRASTS